MDDDEFSVRTEEADEELCWRLRMMVIHGGHHDPEGAPGH